MKMPFKNIKYLEINLTKYMQGMYTENYKRFWEKWKKTQTNEEMYHDYGLKGAMLLKC